MKTTDFKKLTKKDFYDKGVALSIKFLMMNGIEVPKFSLDHHIGLNKHQLTGLYLALMKMVYINIPKTSAIGYGGPAWSFPSYKIDRTAYGVVCHEVGHHIDVMLKYPSRSEEWNILTKKEKVSRYEPTPSEAFAESMRLYITNPDLLRIGCPKRFGYLANELDLKKVTTTGWLTTLENKGCPQRQIDQARNWGVVR